jgi:hypothetical protein
MEKTNLFENITPDYGLARILIDKGGIVYTHYLENGNDLKTILQGASTAQYKYEDININFNVENNKLVLQYTPDFSMYSKIWQTVLLNDYTVRQYWYKRTTSSSEDLFHSRVDTIKDIQLYTINYFKTPVMAPVFANTAKKVVKSAVPGYFSQLIPADLVDNMAFSGDVILACLLQTAPQLTRINLHIINAKRADFLKLYYNYLQTKFGIEVVGLNFTIILNEVKYEVVVDQNTYVNVAQLVTSFDIPSYACAYYKNNLYISERFETAFSTRSNIVDPTVVNEEYCLNLAHCAKYFGFSVECPYLDSKHITNNKQFLDQLVRNGKNQINLNRTLPNNVLLLLIYHYLLENDVDIPSPQKYISNLKRDWYAFYSPSSKEIEYSNWHIFMTFTLVKNRITKDITSLFK